ncbi:unnamed protein product [Arabidopsis halleri]
MLFKLAKCKLTNVLDVLAEQDLGNVFVYTHWQSTEIDDFLDATIPEIHRTSQAGSVLYLKSLDLPDIDILKFDFLDAPSCKNLFLSGVRCLLYSFLQKQWIGGLSCTNCCFSLWKQNSKTVLSRSSSEFRRFHEV